MDQNIELLEYLYEDTKMGSYTMELLLKDLHDKDNHIKEELENILKGYQDFNNKVKQELEENGGTLKDVNVMAKMGSKMNIKKEVYADNSDAAIADMVIEGLTMGTNDVQKRISQFNDTVTKDHQKIMSDFLKFQEDAIEKLKSYL